MGLSLLSKGLADSCRETGQIAGDDCRGSRACGEFAAGDDRRGMEMREACTGDLSRRNRDYTSTESLTLESTERSGHERAERVHIRRSLSVNVWIARCHEEGKRSPTTHTCTHKCTYIFQQHSYNNTV